MLWLLNQTIDSFHREGTEGVGLPLGNLTSQLLVNVYMNEFDHYVKRELKIKYYIRYADDFVILSDNRSELKGLVGIIAVFLEKNLRLSLHDKKLFIKTLSSGMDFLGWVHFPYHRTLRTTTKKRMNRKMREGVTKEAVESYKGMLKHGNAFKIEKSLVYTGKHEPQIHHTST